MRKSLAGLVSMLVFAAACSGPGPEELTTKDAGSIRQQSEAFVAAFNAKDVPKILGLHTDDSALIPPNEPLIRGRDALKNFYDDLLVKRGASNLKLEIAELSGQGPLASQSGTYEMELKPATGTSGRDRGKYLFVLRKMDNGWKYGYTVWNFDLPPAK